MWFRRVIYILILLATYIFFIFYRMWFAWYLMLLVIIIPVVSLIVCLVAYFRFKPDMKMPATLTHNDIAAISLGDATALSKTKRSDDDPSYLYSNYIAIFKVRDYLGDEILTKKFSSKGRREFDVAIDTSHVGAFDYVFDSVKFYDMLGLFAFKRKVGKASNLLVRPRPQTPAVIPQLDNFRTRSLKKSKSQYSEIYDIRDYQTGDSIKNIHWKMSAKKDSVMVREPLEENLENARIVFELVPDRTEMDKKLNELIYISDYFIKKGVNHRINVVPPFNRDVHFEIYSKKDISDMTDEILAMKLPRKRLGENSTEVLETLDGEEIEEQEKKAADKSLGKSSDEQVAKSEEEGKGESHD